MIVLLCGLKDEARVFDGHDGLLVLCGSAQRDDLASLVPADCAGIVSAGCAGALDPGIGVGQLFVASHVVTEDGAVRAADADWWVAASKTLGGPDGADVARVFFSSPRELCSTPGEKKDVRAAYGADVVDMESWAVAKVAAARGLPFLVLRAISDTADQTILPGDARAQRPDGTEDPLPVIGDAIADPAEAVREAVGFGRSLDALRAAFRALGPTFGKPS